MMAAYLFVVPIPNPDLASIKHCKAVKRSNKKELNTMTPEEEKAVADKRKLVEVFRSELMAKVDVSAAVCV